MKQTKLIPDLRFKGFEGEWEEKKLKQLGDTIIGLTYSPEDVSTEGIIVLRSSNIKGNTIDLKDKVIVNKKIPIKLKTNENDILICSRNKH